MPKYLFEFLKLADAAVSFFLLGFSFSVLSTPLVLEFLNFSLFTDQHSFFGSFSPAFKEEERSVAPQRVSRLALLSC